ncbi:universal stress protein [Auraticoccus monumenti]|uniref:Nucleotide-binding universal stress protein, UspA family n=1 Tax=Auraticoccus monumenti TaxID=675864 RepID=A0A1G7A7T8_9ACTN|nr:universal stress protein [Auraticoccus monumenti]SDE10889.1 Nucleotide-binding universal stress protein, UspA family [Auraticoccus monumenti]
MTVAAARSRTAAGHAALAAAVEEARLRRTDLVVLHVIEGLTTEAGDEAAVHAEVAGELAGLEVGDLSWTLRTTAGGRDTAGSLVDLAVEVDAEMLVVGTRRRSPVGKLLLGSVVQRVLLDSPVPVMVVKPAV